MILICITFPRSILSPLLFSLPFRFPLFSSTPYPLPPFSLPSLPFPLFIFFFSCLPSFPMMPSPSLSSFPPIPFAATSPSFPLLSSPYLPFIIFVLPSPPSPYPSRDTSSDLPSKRPLTTLFSSPVNRSFKAPLKHDLLVSSLSLLPVCSLSYPLICLSRLLFLDIKFSFITGDCFDPPACKP